MNNPWKLHYIAYKRLNDIAEFSRFTAQVNSGVACNTDTGSIELPDADHLKVAMKEQSLELPLF